MTNRCQTPDQGSQEQFGRWNPCIPQPDQVSSPYWEAARPHELKIQRCGSCSATSTRRRPLPLLSGTDLRDADQRRGTVYTFIIGPRLMVAGFLTRPTLSPQIRPEETETTWSDQPGNIKECDLHDVHIRMARRGFFEDVTEESPCPSSARRAKVLTLRCEQAARLTSCWPRKLSHAWSTERTTTRENDA